MKYGVSKLAAIMGIAVISTACGLEPRTANSVANVESFRIVTKIFAGKAQTPSAEHLVLFHEGLVYDLPQIDSGQVTVYDLERDRVILLDRGSQVRSTTSTEELLKLTAQLRAKAMTEDSRQRLGVDATVDRSDDLTRYSISYGSLTYDTVTETPTRVSTAKEYGRFADLASQLNIARAVGMPPIGRMTMNRQIAEDGCVPKTTTLTIKKPGGDDTYRSTHELIERISQADRKLIDEVGSMLALYREVDLREFPH